MADYRKMYGILCRAISAALDAPPEKGKRLLQDALYEAEEVYIDTCGEENGEDSAP